MGINKHEYVIDQTSRNFSNPWLPERPDQYSAKNIAPFVVETVGKVKPANQGEKDENICALFTITDITVIANTNVDAEKRIDMRTSSFVTQSEPPIANHETVRNDAGAWRIAIEGCEAILLSVHARTCCIRFEFRNGVYAITEWDYVQSQPEESGYTTRYLPKM